MAIGEMHKRQQVLQYFSASQVTPNNSFPIRRHQCKLSLGAVFVQWSPRQPPISSHTQLWLFVDANARQASAH